MCAMCLYVWTYPYKVKINLHKPHHRMTVLNKRQVQNLIQHYTYWDVWISKYTPPSNATTHFSKLLHDATIQHVAVCTPGTVCGRAQLWSDNVATCQQYSSYYSCRGIRAALSWPTLGTPICSENCSILRQTSVTHTVFINAGFPLCGHHPINIP